MAQQKTEILSFTVPEELAGARLDLALARLAYQYSRSKLQKVIGSGVLTLNGTPCAECRRPVAAGDEVRFPQPGEEIPVSAEPENIPLSVLYEDKSILVIDKPAGMVVHPAAGNWTGTVVNAVLGRGSVSGEDFTDSDPCRPGIVHRLDKDTSGCLVVAKTESAMRKLCEGFAAHEITKTYLAIVAPAPVVMAGQIDTFIGRSPANRKKMAVVRDEKLGRAASTSFRCLRRGRIGAVSAALLEVHIATGRTHQIRVHMAYRGMPVIGDSLYGGNSRIPAPRQMLHAWKLEFKHPSTGKKMAFESPIPADFRGFLDQIEENPLK